eukprot:scaffold7994_cov122-Isochrysis_galbana.AAC.15
MGSHAMHMRKHCLLGRSDRPSLCIQPGAPHRESIPWPLPWSHRTAALRVRAAVELDLGMKQSGGEEPANKGQGA